MADRSFDKVARDLSSDFSALRDDLRKLTNVVSDLATDQRGRVPAAASSARSTRLVTASPTPPTGSRVTRTTRPNRVRGAGAELESRIEKNPLTAVMIAIVGGLLIGAMSRSRR